MNAAATRPFGPPRRASITRGLEKAAAYPERCSSNFDLSMLPETSAASTRRRSTRSAAWVGVQAVVAISAATTKVRRARIMLTPYSTANSRDGCLRSAAVENLSRSRVPRHPLLRVQHQVQASKVVDSRRCRLAVPNVFLPGSHAKLALIVVISVRLIRDEL